MRRPVLLTVVLTFAVVLLAFDTGTGSAQTRKPASRATAKTRAAAKKKTPPPPKVNLPTQIATEEIEVAPVSPTQRDKALASAAHIDALLEAALRKNGAAPNEMTTDEQFVRRTYLDITGTIPTADQTLAYLKSTHPSKRVALIDSMLGKPGYASNFYNYWADVLRIVDQADNNTYLRPYGEWVKECLRENRPWDEMVHEMVTAEGKVWEDPAVGFVLRDAGMPLDNLNNMIRTFLGTRIGCAQCHDHPFDRWKQKEFYQLAAFVGGTQYRVDRPRGYRINDKQIQAASPGMQSQEYRNGRTILRYNRVGVWLNAKENLKYPHDYAYKDVKPDEIVKPAVLFGSAPGSFKPEERRQILADWITSYDNERFAKTLANRLWKRAFGIGLIEPVDDLRDDTEASNPELMNFLISELHRLQFNMKEFQRIIYYTKAYQRQVSYDDLDPEKPYLFPGPVLRRMTAEQVWDSLLTLTLKKPDAMVRPDDEEYTAILDIDEKTTVQQVLEKAKELQNWRKDDGAEKRKRLYKGVELLRASELPQPLPESHFLRQFGQSDRDITLDSHTDGTVPQLLTMFNGPVTHMMLEYGSVIFDEVMARRALDDRVDVMFLSILNRYPTDSERDVALREIRRTLRDKQYQYAGHGNVLWALLNTREFLFIQ
ncbi:DUF1549 domain-containing protein [bacterium]|nr:DUF1549 domain-containing protein [bacterium]